MQGESASITVSIPANPEFVQILRLTVGSVAARLDSSYETVQDLTLAIDEACAQLLGARPPPSRITLSIAPTPTGVEVSAFADSAADPWPPTGAEQAIGWQILQALAENARFQQADDRGVGIRFSKGLAGGFA